MYRWAEHTGEIELRIEDESPEAVFREALVAFGDMISEQRGGDPVTHPLRIEAADLPALLAEWMNELVYLAETDGFVPERVERLRLLDGGLEAEIAGQRQIPRNPVKAVTYHNLEMRAVGGSWRARVVLDV